MGWLLCKSRHKVFNHGTFLTATSDPLFQETLVNVVRRNAHLFGQPERHDVESTPNDDWHGLPVIFDEVFTGMFRLGRFSAARFLGVWPDISVHAKLLTGGLIPLCVTMASNSIFETFISKDKTEALLHGHSYTAHPVGCQVALKSVETMLKMNEGDDWTWAQKDWGLDTWSFWEKSFVEALSGLESKSVGGVWALGSVLAIHMKTETAGYTSNSAKGLQAALLEGYPKEFQGDGNGGWNVHSRVLGNVLYIMTSLTTTHETVKRLQDILMHVIRNN